MANEIWPLDSATLAAERDLLARRLLDAASAAGGPDGATIHWLLEEAMGRLALARRAPGADVGGPSETIDGQARDTIVATLLRDRGLNRLADAFLDGPAAPTSPARPDARTPATSRPAFQPKRDGAETMTTAEIPGREHASADDQGGLGPLGYKIFLDRYAHKDMTKKSIAPGDTVVVVVDQKTGQREIGTVTARNDSTVAVELRDGGTVQQALEHVDKPLETHPAQMVARVARGIAAVEAPAKQEEWRQNFEWLLSDWRFIPGGRILAAAGTDQQLTFYNCMPPDQEVLTDTGYRPIGDIAVGDLVVTHRNRMRRVLHVFERQTSEPLYVIEPKKLGFDRLRVTGEHPVLAIRADSVNAHRSRDGLRLAEEPGFIRARDLKPGDYVAVAHDAEGADGEAPITINLLDHLPDGEYADDDGVLVKVERVGRPLKFPVPVQVTVDERLMLLFGHWLGDGCVTHRTGTDIPSGIQIAFHAAHETWAQNIGSIITEKFGVSCSITRDPKQQCIWLWANSMPLGEFFESYFGAYSYKKAIPAELMHMGNRFTRFLVKGLLQADGYVSGQQTGIVLSNRTLASQLHSLLLRQGMLFSIFENSHTLGRHPAYRLTATDAECGELREDVFGERATVTGRSGFKSYLEHDGRKWVRIERISVEHYDGPVIDLEVEEDHSFVSAGVVVSNCFVIPSPKDSRRGIIETLSQMMEIMSRGGGVGINVSSLRPKHAYVKGVNGRSSGAVSWGGLYSFVTGLIEQGGSRRGALMLILNDWHPDLLEFISAKREMGKITNANISVGISDAFMKAVHDDADWPLVFPDTSGPDFDEHWDGDLNAWKAAGRPVIQHRTVKAREVWNQIIESAWASAEPGVYFVERANNLSNSWYYAQLACTNPCGEQPLPAWGVCNLASIHLAKFVTGDREVAWEDLGRAVRYGVRFLDNVIDATPYFFEENAQQQLRERRIGLGTMGLGEMLIRLGIRYGSPESERFIDRLYEFIASESYLASADFAAEKGSFPEFDADKLLQSGYMQALPEKVRAAVKEKGLRNVTLLTQAPTGSTGTMMDTSTGIEPFFSWTYLRKSRLGIHEETVKVAHEWQAQHPGEELPDYFVTAMDLSPEEHVRVEAAIQRGIDSSISKTANLPAEYTVEQTRELYELMYQLGCKGGTVYRDSSRDEQVLMLKPADAAPATTVVTVTATQEPAPVEEGRPKPQRVHLPDERRSVTHKFQVGEQEGYITVGLYDDGQPGEVFLRVSKQGSTVSGLMESLGLLTSVALQYGVPLEGLARKMKNSRFEPYGMTTNREIPTATSLVDYVFRWLEKKFVLGEQLPLLNGGTQTMLALDAPAPAPATAMVEKAHVEHIPSGMGCPECGSLLYHAEGCLICQSCGYTKCG